ncbi:hypothetical protein ILUMI_26306, partial [Ignelater luminosus]
FFQNEYHLIPHHGEMIRYNREFVDQWQLKSFKYNRTSVAFNFTMQFRIEDSRKLEMITQAYMFLSNEYRYFPIRFEVNWCKAFAVNYGGMGNILKCGNYTGCPLQK